MWRKAQIWDLRQKKVVREYGDQEDFVSDLLFVEEKSTLLAASGDGTLAVYDPRYHKAVARSDQLEDELLSLAVMKVRALARPMQGDTRVARPGCSGGGTRCTGLPLGRVP